MTISPGTPQRTFPQVSPAKASFKAHMRQVREDAIVEAANRLLAEKGFDLMTVDEVAAEVGIAKASLYKHFTSKEDLAAAAMLRLLTRAQALLASLPANARPLEQLKAVLRWMLQLQLAGDMPALPSQNSSLRLALMAHPVFPDQLRQLGAQIGGQIAAAQQDGSLNPRLPADVVLYILYARACDPVLAFLKAGGRYGDEVLVELVLAACFEGLNAR